MMNAVQCKPTRQVLVHEYNTQSIIQINITSNPDVHTFIDYNYSTYAWFSQDAWHWVHYSQFLSGILYKILKHPLGPIIIALKIIQQMHNFVQYLYESSYYK